MEVPLPSPFSLLAFASMPIVVVVEDDLVVVPQRRNKGLLDACLDEKRTANFVALFIAVASFPFVLVVDA